MTLYELWNNIISIPGVKTVLIISILSIIEISPIKINPWSWIGGLIGRLLGIKKISDKIDAVEKKVDENYATTVRVRILRFENDVQQNIKQSKDSWDQVMDDIRRYELYVQTHPEFKNNITTATINHLTKRYSELLEERAWTMNLTSKDRR